MNQPLPRYVDYMYSYPHKTAYRSFPSPVSLVPYLKQVEGQKASLYFHIPFCSHKCGYCNLFSRKQIVRIISQLIWKLFTSRRNSCLRSLPDWHLIVSPLEEAHRCSHCSSTGILTGYSCLIRSASFTYLYFRRNIAGYADPARLDLLKQAGVARVSIGVQSFLDED